MHSLADQLVHALRGHMWRYITNSAHRAEGVVAAIESLSGISAEELDLLLRVHLATGDATRAVLEASETIVRKLKPGLSRAREITHGWVDGDIDWSHTIEHRLDTGDITAFACSPTKRRYHSFQTQLLVAALDYCIVTSRNFPLGMGPLRSLALSYGDRALAARMHTKLKDIRPARDISIGRLERLAIIPGYKPVASYLNFAVFGVGHHDAETAIHILEEQVLKPQQADKLFELWVGFAIVDALTDFGYVAQSLQAITGSRKAFAILSGPLGRIRIWRQRGIEGLTIPSAEGRYASVRKENGLQSSSLIPDWIIEYVDAGRVIPVEVKLYEHDPAAGIRHGIVELFAYLHDRPDVYGGRHKALSLLVSWNAPTRPSANSHVIIASQTSIREGIEMLLSSIASPAEARNA